MLVVTSPRTESELPTLWVVVLGGLEDSRFPWGNVVRISKH